VYFQYGSQLCGSIGMQSYAYACRSYLSALEGQMAGWVCRRSDELVFSVEVLLCS
jgi:hypothetical protein